MEWEYWYSEALGMKYAMREQNEIWQIMTEDKTQYTMREIEALGDKQITRGLHFVKRAFNGTIMEDKG